VELQKEKQGNREKRELAVRGRVERKPAGASLGPERKVKKSSSWSRKDECRGSVSNALKLKCDSKKKNQGEARYGVKC